MGRRKYKIIIEDETRIERVGQWPISLWSMSVWSLLFILLCVAVAVCVIMLTPLRQLLPGYMKDDQRMQIERNMLKVDSLRSAYDKNDAYIQNLLAVFNTDRNVGEIKTSLQMPSRTSDTLMTATEKERKFVASYNERERYNVSILAPLAADGMSFSPLSPRSIMSAEQSDSVKARVVLARGENVGCIADGVVLDVGYNGREGGSTCVVQHGRGFVSRYSRLGKVIVVPGQRVTSSQIIALQNSGTGKNMNVVTLQLWRNGDALWPGDYIGN